MLSEWIEERGYKWDGPSIKMYTGKPKVEAGRTIVSVKVEAPIQKK